MITFYAVVERRNKSTLHNIYDGQATYESTEVKKIIKNGRPYSIENGHEDAGLITDHSQEEIDLVCNWIVANIYSRRTPSPDYTSYGIKHILQSNTGIYLTNNEFKDAMLLCGYTPVNPDELNWHYCISKRSPVFDQKSRKQ